MDGTYKNVTKKEKPMSKRKRNIIICNTNNNDTNNNNNNKSNNNINNTNNNNKSEKSRTKTKNMDDDKSEDENTEDDSFVLSEEDLLERLKKCKMKEETKRKRRDRRKEKRINARTDLEKSYQKCVASFLINYMAIGYVTFYQLFLKSNAVRKFDGTDRKKKQIKSTNKHERKQKRMIMFVYYVVVLIQRILAHKNHGGVLVQQIKVVNTDVIGVAISNVRFSSEKCMNLKNYVLHLKN